MRPTWGAYRLFQNMHRGSCQSREAIGRTPAKSTRSARTRPLVRAIARSASIALELILLRPCWSQPASVVPGSGAFGDDYLECESSHW